MIRLGMIGISEGNGHPYSWSAILNGYNPDYMKTCPFPIIPEYLNQHSFPENANAEARVTHIWCQNQALSKHIAAAAKVPNIVNDYRDMIDAVDAILLARDDAENHYLFSKDFLQAGLPIYIDKLIAYNQKDANKIFSLQQYDGQIFTGSALAYSPDFLLDQVLGNLICVDASVMNGFKKYGIHVVEPVLKLIGEQGKISTVNNLSMNAHDFILVDFESGLRVYFSAMHTPYAPITIRLFGDNGYKILSHENTFHAFKNALDQFIKIVQHKALPDSYDFVMQVVKIMESCH